MKKSTKTILCLGAALALAAGAYLTFENEALMLTEYDFVSDKVPKSFDGFKILHLSDIHAKSPRRLHGDLIKLAEKQSPDIIVITGDLIDHRAVNIPCAVSLAERLAGIAPVYYVTGNHEEALPIADYNEALTELTRVGVEVLNARTVRIERDGDEIALCGIFDTPNLPPQEGVATELFDPSLLNIALFHRPQMGGQLIRAGADLVLAGHAHGGQMQIPGVGGLIAPDQGFFPKYTKGLYRLGGGVVEVSRGVGNSLIPFRVNNRPEVVCVRLRASR